jgi:hypothetical protein
MPMGRAVVHTTGVVQGRDETRTQIRWQAYCACGWVGETRELERQSERDAIRHKKSERGVS